MICHSNSQIVYVLNMRLRFNLDDQDLTYLQQLLATLMNEIDMIGAPFGHFPILRFIAPEMSGYKSFLEVHQQLWKFLKVNKSFEQLIHLNINGAQECIN